MELKAKLWTHRAISIAQKLHKRPFQTAATLITLCEDQSKGKMTRAAMLDTHNAQMAAVRWRRVVELLGFKNLNVGIQNKTDEHKLIISKQCFINVYLTHTVSACGRIYVEPSENVFRWVAGRTADQILEVSTLSLPVFWRIEFGLCV